MSAHKLRMKTAWILLLFGLTSVCGVSLLKPLYEAEEEDNMAVRLYSPSNVDLSHLNISCFFKTRTVKMLELVRGEEQTQDQHRQFSGRVQLDREALRLGQVQLQLTRLTSQDSGLYVCHTEAEYNSEHGQWTLRSTVYFAINVAVKNGTSLETTKPGSDNDVKTLREGPAPYKRDQDKTKFIFECVIVGFIIMGSLFFISVTIVRALCTPANKEHKLLSNYSPAV